MATTTYQEFLTELFDEGKIVFRTAPRDRPSPSAVAVLAEAFQALSITVAGPPIAFDPQIACAAAEFLRQSAWALVSRDDRTRDVEKRLKMPDCPLTPARHLSADLTMRYLPQVLRRVRGLDPSGSLVARLASVLRAWPLSGVLSDVKEAPLVPVEFRRAFGAHALVCGTSFRQRSTIVAADTRTDGATWGHYELVVEEHAQTAPAARESEVHGG